MRSKLRWLYAAAASVLMAGALAGAVTIATTAPALAAGPCGTTTTAPTYKHVIWIWFENHSSSSIIGSSQAPYFNTIANECGLATNYHNLSHPSLPNYVGATSGLAVKIGRAHV